MSITLDEVADRIELMRQESGDYPNLITLTGEEYDGLRTDPEVIARIKYPPQDPPVSHDQLVSLIAPPGKPHFAIAVTRSATHRRLRLECGHYQTELVPDSGPRILSVDCRICGKHSAVSKTGRRASSGQR